MNTEEARNRIGIRPWRLVVLLLGFAGGVPLRTVGDGSLHSDERTSNLRWQQEHPLGAM
jgi:hypothetical protein